MCCSGIVRLHATLAEGTFLLLRGSYDIFGNDGFVKNFNLGISISSFFLRFFGICSFLNFFPVTRGCITPVWGSGMCCSGIVQLHATLAEGTFLLLRGSYEIFGNDGFVKSFILGISISSSF